MIEFYKPMRDARFTASQSALAISSTLKDTGVAANENGRKIVYAGTPVKNTAGDDFLADRDTVAMCLPGDGPLAVAVLRNDVDVTDGDAPCTIFISGALNYTGTQLLPSGATTALKAKGFKFVGAHKDAPPPVLAFDITNHLTIGSVKIAAVLPVAGQGNTYRVHVVDKGDLAIAQVGTVIASVGAAYTLGNPIVANADKYVILYEVDGDNKVVKAGYGDADIDLSAAPLTFEVEDHTDAGSGMIETVEPEVTEGNTYRVLVHTDDEEDIELLVFGAAAGAVGAAYTLEAAIVCETGDFVILYEVDGDDKVIKAGYAEVEVDTTP